MTDIALTEGISERNLQAVYADPYIARIGHDHRPAAPVRHPLVTYLTATVNGAFAGAFMAVQANANELELHALLKKSFLRHSRALGAACLRWAFESRPVLRVTAYIIEGMESVRNYCLKLGMTLEGFKRDACLKHGTPKGIYILGMTRRDWSKAWAL